MKLLITIFALVIVSLFSLLIVTSAKEAEDSFDFVIAYSSNLEGYLEPCG